MFPTRRWLAVLAVVLVAALVAPATGAKKKNKGEEEDVDYLALAARLVRDGHFDRAAVTLERVDETDEGVDKQRLFILRGVVSMHNQVYVDAAENFEKAIAAGASDPVVFIGLAQASFGKKDYRGVVNALDRAGPTAEEDSRAELLRSRAHWELGEPGPALDVLARARVRFPDTIEFPRLEMFYLIKLGLFQELNRRREAFLARADIGAPDLAAIAEAMRKGGHLDEARVMLEAARLRFPDSEELAILDARVFMDQDSVLSSAIVLEHAARLNSKYLVEAAEMYRRAGRLERALFINARVTDQKAKMKQRLQILLELERFEMISAMEARLSRLGLLGDEQIRYALAYGFFMIRDFVGAERHIAHLQGSEMFSKGVQLRKAIQNCKDAGWLCQ